MSDTATTPALLGSVLATAPSIKLNEQEQRLIALFRDGSERDRETLLRFAEFIAARLDGSAVSSIPAPEPIPRPDSETVVAAIKRLSRSYAMLDKAKMLNETSILVSQHVVEGRDAVEVIDELESLFSRHYEKLRQAQ